MKSTDISKRQMTLWRKSQVVAYDADGYVAGYGLPAHWPVVAFDLGCVYYRGKVPHSAAWDFVIGDNACTYRVRSKSLARALRAQAEEWKNRHSGAKFHARLLAAAEEVRPGFVPRDGLLYGSDGEGQFYMYDARTSPDTLVFTLDERGYLHSLDGTQLNA